MHISKYEKWYNNIVNSAKLRGVPDGYYELHHIQPRCLGGTDEDTNLVALTAREHFICHWLLTKISPVNAILYGFVAMSLVNPHQDGRYKLTSKQYEIVKKMNSIATSHRFKGKTKSFAGKKRYHDPISGEAKLFDENCQPEGWLRGNSPQFNSKMIGKNVGRVYYYNQALDKGIAVKDGEVVPDGYVKFSRSASKAGMASAKINAFDPITGDFLKFHSTVDVPEGWVIGSPMVWVNNGDIQKQINSIKETIDAPWIRGKLTGKPIKKRVKPIATPLGVFDHPYRFCEMYDVGPDFFDSLDKKVRLRSSNGKLIDALKDVGYDFSKTKSENGFYFMTKGE